MEELAQEEADPSSRPSRLRHRVFNNHQVVNEPTPSENQQPVKPKERPYRRSVFDLASWLTWGNEDSDTAWERERDEEEQE